MNILFVDDEKQPQWFDLKIGEIGVARSARQAIRMWKQSDDFDTIFLDHDLGGKRTGYEVLKECIKIRKPDRIVFITLNPVGRKRMMDYCDDYHIPYEVNFCNFFEEGLDIDL